MPAVVGPTRTGFGLAPGSSSGRLGRWGVGARFCVTAAVAAGLLSGCSWVSMARSPSRIPGTVTSRGTNASRLLHPMRLTTSSLVACCVLGLAACGGDSKRYLDYCTPAPDTQPGKYPLE